MRFAILAAVLPIALLAAPVQAQFAPTGTNGPLPAATFGGSGIPNTSVMQSVFDGVLLGMNATGRYANPTVTDNGAGTYYAVPGSDGGSLARWNFNFFIGGANAGNYSYVLYYDFDPAVGTLVADHGKFNMAFAGGPQNSWNLGFNFLNSNIGGVVDDPTYASFDPTVSGDYTFAIGQYDGEGNEVNLVAIDVQAGVVATPEPASMVLMASGLFAVGFVVRRRKN